MSVTRMGLVPGILLIAAEVAFAQAAIPSVVQLPSFRTFSYSGTIVVPDSGGAYLGGVKRSASSTGRRGLNRSLGVAQSHPHAAVHATIIDHDEIDRQLLGGTKQEFLASERGKAPVVDPAEEGKALVRFARQQYRQGNQAASFDAYRMAIRVLHGRLRDLAKAEFRRVHGTAADQALRVASARRR